MKGSSARCNRRSVLLGGAAALALLAGRARAEQPAYTKTTGRLEIPDVTLVDQDGAKQRVRELVDASRPTLVQFIFTSCGAICPLMGATFANFQRRLGEGAKDVRLVSISIDPDNDTPAKMREFLKRMDARPGWSFLTGSREDVGRVTKAFASLEGDKMQHAALTFLASPPAGAWIRILGLIPAGDLVDEYKRANRK